MSNLPMQKGYYAARATDTPIKFGTASTGTNQISVEFELLGEEWPNERFTWLGNFTDLTAERAVESLQIAGWQGDDLSELDDQPASRFLTEEVSLVIEPDTDNNGVVRLKVQWVNRPGGGKFKFKNELAGNDLKAFAAQMKATVKSVRASGGAPRRTAGAGQQRAGGSGGGGGYGRANAPSDRNVPPPSDDDLPFASCDPVHDPNSLARMFRGTV
jgi:hypothetical protein